MTAMRLRKMFKRLRPKGTTIIFSLLGLLSVDRSLACTVLKPTNISEIDRADLVFRGRVISYTPPPKMRDGSRTPQDATITLIVVETLRGPTRSVWSIKRKDVGFGLPQSWSGDRDVIAAAKRDPSGYNSDDFILYQNKCSPAFLFPDADEILRSVRRSLTKP